MKTIFTAIFIILLLSACTKTLDVKLRSTEPKIVIQGNVTNSGGPYYIRINKTVDFDANNEYPPVVNATVSVLDSNTRRVDYYKYTGVNGYYISNNLFGQVGHTYKLTVTVDGETYTASSTMPNFVGINQLDFVQTKILNKTRILPQVTFTDPAYEKNYYVFSLAVNNVTYKAFYAVDDRLTDGNEMVQQLYMDSSYIQKRDFVTVILSSVDKNVYNYFNVLQANSGASPTTPSNPPSNISNGAYGYFGAEAVSMVSQSF
ncbi:DUF4249 family protein [Chitinophaga sancti]|uniref:DUF4249 family protein n=1 Tax=Chitinophaga sancti TaxID=1004 RepID=UPI003F7AA0C4